MKVRGTAQTVAEKYMQLGRDAQSSGDNVMAESYFQFSEHYFRVMAAAQPVGQPTQQLRRPEDDDFEDDGEEGSDGEAEGAPANGPVEASQAGQAEQSDVSAEAGQEGDRADQRNFRQRDNRDNNRERFRPRWQNQKDQPRQDATAAEPLNGENESPSSRDEQPREAQVESRPVVSEGDTGSGQWEAPSFLRRPAPTVIAADEATEPPVAEKRARAPRRPRAASVEETPQGE